MPKFQVVAPHLPTECILAGEEMLAHDPKLLKKMWLGCDFGDHTAYVMVDAENLEAAKARIPALLRSKTRVVQVKHPDPEKVKNQHTTLI